MVGPEPPTPSRGGIAAPRLSRSEVRLPDGSTVGVAVSGIGVPLVMLHGFALEGFLYAQSLSRLVGMGFKVIAVDVANHGHTSGLPTGGHGLEAYARLVGHTLDELGVGRSVLVGHSMGGRLVAELAAREPHRAGAVILIDPIVGLPWDRMVTVGRIIPPVFGVVLGALAVDTVLTGAAVARRGRLGALARLAAPTVAGHIRRPWRIAGPAVSIWRSGGSRWLLEALADEAVCTVIIHGDRDLAVPFPTAVSAARLAHATLVRVRGGSHSWLLGDPEAPAAIVADLLRGRLGDAYRRIVVDAGGDPDAPLADIEDLLHPPGSLIRELTPPLELAVTGARRHRPALSWEITDFSGRPA